MRTVRVGPALLIALLIGLSPVAAAPHLYSSMTLPYNALLPSGYYDPIQILASATPTTVSFAVSSNASLSIALMTNSQATSFANGNAGVSDSLYVVNASAATHTASVSEGIYYLMFYAYGSNVNITFGIDTFPISPYAYYPLTAPQPMGVASFGLYNNSGVVTPYSVRSSDVVGVADITALQAYNASAALYNDTLSGATLQLNSILVVNEKGGLQQDYWTQDTPDFVTSADQVSWADNIWNSSVSGILSNATITSKDGGYVYSFSEYPGTGYYYSYQSSNYTYSASASHPLKLALVMSETVISGVGVLVQMGAQAISNGSASARPIDWFDNATINDPTVQSAYFYVSGNATVPNGEFYDTEFVFGGEGNGEATTFTQLSASLGLFYGNSTAAAQSAYPSYYSFGGNTGETTYNLHVSYAGNGFSEVGLGSPNYVYLGAASGSCTLPPSGTCEIPNATATTSQTTSSTSSTGVSSLIAYLTAGILVLVIVVVVLLMVMRRKPATGQAEGQPTFPSPPASGFCAYCGSPVPQTAKFCPSCGAPVSEESSRFNQGERSSPSTDSGWDAGQTGDGST